MSILLKLIKTWDFFNFPKLQLAEMRNLMLKYNFTVFTQAIWSFCSQFCNNETLWTSNDYKLKNNLILVKPTQPNKYILETCV